MKFKSAVGLLALFAGSLAAEEKAPEIPAEPAEPPYEVGDLLDEKGYTIEREDLPDLNFRIVNNRIRLYWIDDDRLIVEPEVDEATVRFRGSVRGRPYHRLSGLSDDTGLGGVGILPPPHILDTVLVVGTDEAGEPLSYLFRYNATMSPESEDSGSTEGGESPSD